MVLRSGTARNELSFMNDFRTDVRAPDAPQRRVPNCVVAQVVLDGLPRLLVVVDPAGRGVAEGVELLVDYGDSFWEGYRRQQRTAGLLPNTTVIE
jgi:hypothetical protein